MEEKLKGFLTKDAPTDEELELFLFAMNQHSYGMRVALAELCKAIKKRQLALDEWIIPRLKSEKQISEGLHNTLCDAMNTMQDTVISLGGEIEYLTFFQEERNRHYMEADVIGHFDWQKK